MARGKLQSASRRARVLACTFALLNGTLSFSAQSPAPVAAMANINAAPGPWGRLEYSRILIEPPEDFVPVEATTPQQLRWTFRGYDDARLAALWQKAGLSAEQRAALDPAGRRATDGDALVLHPDPAAVMGLSPEARGVIYTALALFPENGPQRDPFRVRSEDLHEWFDQTVLPADVIALTRQLLYRRNNAVVFSDADLVLPRIASTDTRIDFIKNLSRKSTLLVQLRLDASSDADALTRYWGQGRRRKDVRPLLQSLIRRPSGGTLDIAHLLPSFPRSLIYTYPVPSADPQAAAHDCHWTSLNFFNHTPDERFTDIGAVQEALTRDYTVVDGPPALGDILVFVERGGRVVHSCVYVADDIVFTKNGATFSTPWQFGQLPQLVAFYTLGEPLQVRRYRARTE